MSDQNFWKEQVRTKQFITSTVLFVVVEIVLLSIDAPTGWHFMSVYTLFLCGSAQVSTTPGHFFRGAITSKSQDGKSQALLTLSAFISWIFAKSIYNASVLGGKYGITGGWGYAAWYVSFFSTAAIVYNLRVRYEVASLPELINKMYGRTATLGFALIVFYRLYQEVWSNAAVVASFFGSYDTGPGAGASTTFHNWFFAAVLSSVIPLVYVLMGGMRSSLLSDAFQALVAILFLVVVLGMIGSDHGGDEQLKAFARSRTDGSASLFEWNPALGNATTAAEKAEARSMKSLAGGMDLLATGLLQGMMSYPFFDPVLTDRAFLTEPKKMFRAFVIGGGIAALFIVFFSIIGIYGNMLYWCHKTGACGGTDGSPNYLLSSDLKAGKPVAVALALGSGSDVSAAYQFVLIIMMTTSMSTLDSTFSSVAKLCGPDLSGFFSKGRPLSLEAERNELTAEHIRFGRLAMVFLCVIGLLPLLSDPTVLSATTASGTIVMGLGPPIFMLAFLPKSYFRNTVRPLAFHVPVWSGVVMGIMYQLSGNKCCKDEVNLDDLKIGTGSYAKLLGTNVAGALICLLLYVIFMHDACWGHYERADGSTNVEDKPSNAVEMSAVVPVSAPANASGDA